MLNLLNLRKVRWAAVLAAALCVGGQRAATAYAADGEDGWIGTGVLKGGKGYAPTPMGQVHYRDLGPRDSKLPPLLLLHMSPVWMIQYAEAQPELAALGLRSVAVDTPGYGLSDPPGRQPTITEFADNLIAVLDHLKIPKAVVVGHHTGATIGASLATRHPDRVAGVVLHGVPIFSAEEIKRRLSRPPSPRAPREDGRHLSGNFRPAAPGEPPRHPMYLTDQTWLAISSWMQGPDIGHYAVYHHDMLSDLKRIKAPGMIVSDVEDSIHPLDLEAAKVRSDFVYREISGAGFWWSMKNEPKKWAKIVADFVTGSVKSQSQ